MDFPREPTLAQPPLDATATGSSTLKSSLQPWFRQLWQIDAKAIGVSLTQLIHWQDAVLLVSLAVFTVSFVQVLYEFIHRSLSKLQPSRTRDRHGDYHSTIRPYKQSTIYLVATHLQHITQIVTFIYLVDVLRLIGIGLGWSVCNLERVPHAVSQTTLTLYGCNRLSALLRYGLRSHVSNHPDLYGRMKVVQRLCEAVLYTLTVMLILNILQVQMGLALQSILALGSVGTVAFGLASQGVTKEVLNGLMLASSDRIYEGDHVQFGNGLQGTVVRLGWMETILRGSDEILVSVPNTNLVNQRVANLSRVPLSQVKQVLEVNLDSADQVPVLLRDLENEIRRACPHLIDDGSRPFRIHWTGMKGDKFEITIDTRHRVRPISERYWENRQNVLAAIHRALKRQRSSE